MTEFDGKVQQQYYDCHNPCVSEAKKHYPTSIATCKQDETEGYYSDTSYYDSPSKNSIDHRLYVNKHKLKDKYEKTEWQKARDECMEQTSSIKKKFLEKSMAFQEKTFSTYNDCLKERGF